MRPTMDWYVAESESDNGFQSLSRATRLAVQGPRSRKETGKRCRCHATSFARQLARPGRSTCGLSFDLLAAAVAVEALAYQSSAAGVSLALHTGVTRGAALGQQILGPRYEESSSARSHSRLMMCRSRRADGCLVAPPG